MLDNIECGQCHRCFKFHRVGAPRKDQKQDKSYCENTKKPATSEEMLRFGGSIPLENNNQKKQKKV